MFAGRLGRLVSQEARLAGFALRAPSLIAATRPRSAATYAESSKWGSLAILVLAAFVPDTVFVWLVPLPLWGHLLAVLADAYGSMWLVGAYGSVVLMTHEPWSEPVVLHNGIFAQIELPRDAIASVEVLDAAEQAAVRKCDAIARAMSVPGTQMVRVRLRGEALFRPRFGPARNVTGAVYASSDAPDQLAHALR